MRTDLLETKNPRNILIVDDEEEVCQYLRTLLVLKTSHKVEFTLDAQDALDRVRKGPVHLVLSDIKMPSMDGIELLREIKKIDPDVEVVMLTGQSSLESAIESLQYRAYDYLEKPISSSRLLHVVGNALARQELSRELSEMVVKVVRLNRALKFKARQHVQVQSPMNRSLTARVVLDAVADAISKPLATITSAVASLFPQSTSGAPSVAHVQRLTDAVSALEGLSADLRHLPGVAPMDPQPTDIVALLRGLIDDIRELYSSTPLEVELPDLPVEACIDAVAVSDVVSALFEHTLRAARERDRLWIQGRVEGPHFVLTVLDEGRDLTDLQMSRFFDPLSDLAGLGLVIARQVAMDHGGSLTIERAIRRGTVVEMRLPLAGPGR